MKVLTYGRISQDDDTSLPNQKQLNEDYAEENDLDVVAWESDENVSGKVHPKDRDGFQRIISHLREDSEISIILVKNGKRLARGISASEIENFLQMELGREVDIIKTNPSGLDEQVERMSNAEEGSTDWAAQPMMEGAQKMVERQKIAEAIKQGKLATKQKEQKDQPFHRPPRGITTDKQKFDKDEATEWVPVDTADEDYDEFDTCIEILSNWTEDDEGPYTSRGSGDGPTGGPSGYSVGKEYGMSNPSQKIKSMWENRDYYREVAEAHRPRVNIEF